MIVAQLVDKLKKQIIIESKDSTGISTNLLAIALSQINEHKTTQSATESWEFYLTLKEIVKIVLATKKAEDLNLLKEQFSDFLAKRENIFKGDSKDCNSHTPGNSVCRAVIKILFPDKNPDNVLLTIATTENRAQPWIDHIESSTDLPEAGYYFRNTANQIHLYYIILERAIANLKAGYSELNQIWMGTDPTIDINSQPSTISNAYDTPLSEKDLSIIRQRTPTFAILVDYTKNLADEIRRNAKTAADYFHDLRVGLLKGDASHSGSELQAGAEAYIAIIEFMIWWRTLDAVTKNKIRSLKIESSIYGDTNSMAAVLDIILDTESSSKRSGVSYCIKLKGQRLDEIISDPAIRATLNEIVTGQKKNADPRLSNEVLDEWQQKITQELDTVKPRIQQEDNLYVYTRSKGIIIQTVVHDFFDYSLLQDKTLSKQITQWHRKYAFNNPVNKANISEIINNILAAQSTNFLLLLYAHYLYQATSVENMFLTAIKHRLYDLSQINNFRYEDLNKKFPFFDVLTKQAEDIAFESVRLQILNPKTALEWSSAITVLNDCRLNTKTYPILKKLIQRARLHSSNASSYQVKLLEKILAKCVLQREITAYEKRVASRISERQSAQRNQSILRIKQEISKPLEEMMEVPALIDLIKENIQETATDHKKSWFSWITNSNLVQAYQRALVEIDDTPPSSSGILSFFNRFFSVIFRYFSSTGGDFPPPPPPPPSSSASSSMLALAFHDGDLSRIQVEALTARTFFNLRVFARSSGILGAARAAQSSDAALSLRLQMQAPAPLSLHMQAASSSVSRQNAYGFSFSSTLARAPVRADQELPLAEGELVLMRYSN